MEGDKFFKLSQVFVNGAYRYLQTIDSPLGRQKKGHASFIDRRALLRYNCQQGCWLAEEVELSLQGTLLFTSCDFSGVSLQ